MNKSDTHAARCLCGAVRLKAGAFNGEMAACHCSMCRKWGGGPFMVVDCGTEVDIEGAEHVAVFDSSKWAERGFCNRCGTHLFYRLKGNQQHQVPIGLFDDSPEVHFGLQVFIDEKPGYYAFADETSTMTGAEVFAKYSPADE